MNVNNTLGCSPESILGAALVEQPYSAIIDMGSDPFDFSFPLNITEDQLIPAGGDTYCLPSFILQWIVNDQICGYTSGNVYISSCRSGFQFPAFCFDKTC
jgi:hypothetical protein